MTMKILYRYYYETMNINETPQVGKFVCEGEWADGHLAYSLLDEDGYVILEDQCMFVQLRGNINGRNCLYMQRI